MDRRNFLRTSLAGIGGTVLYTAPSDAQNEELPNPKLVSRFAPPTNYATGITADGGDLWTAHEDLAGERRIYKISTDGRVMKQFQITGENKPPQFYGITATENHIFAAGNEFEEYEYNIPRIIKISKDGEQKALYEPGDTPFAITTNGESLFTSRGDKLVRKLSFSTNLVRSIPVSARFDGLSYDGTDFWGVDNKRILKFSSDGTISQRFSTPGSAGAGIAHDGRYLYMVTDSGNRILKLDPDIDEAMTDSGSSDSQTSSDSNGQTDSGPMDSSEEQDSDGDGVPDSEDYAPRDPEVQDEGDTRQPPEQETAGDDGAVESEDSSPGLGIISGLAGLSSASYMLKRRMDRQDSE